MPTRNFRELLDAMPAERRRRVAAKVQETIAARPLRAADDAGQACGKPVCEPKRSIED